MGLPTLHLLELQKMPIFEQLLLEEALIRADDRNWILFNTGSPPACILGLSGKVEKLIYLPYLKKKPIPIIRRFSGGGTVVVDEQTLFFTLICRCNDLNLPPFPKNILQWTSQRLSSLFPESLFQLRENDFVLGDKKFGGNALYITKPKWLVHTSFLWDYKEEMMQYLLLPEKQPAYRLQRFHSDFLCCLKDHFPSQNVFIELLLEELKTHFTLKKTSIEEASMSLDIPHRQSTTLVTLPTETTVSHHRP